MTMNATAMLAIGIGFGTLIGWAVAIEPTTRPARFPLIVGHRGLASECPENTLASFRAAFEQGADAVETDCWLTKDGHVVLIHDADTARTCGKPGLKVSESTFETLRTLDAGVWKGESFKGEKLPALAELLAMIPAGKIVYLEIKCGPEIVPEFVREVRASKLKPDQVRVITFNDAVIPAIREALPEVQAYLLFDFKKDESDHWNDTAEGLVKRAKALGADGLDLGFRAKNADRVTPDLVALAAAGGLSFHVWTIDDAALAQEAIALGAASLTTNRAGGLRAELAALTAGKTPQ